MSNEKDININSSSLIKAKPGMTFQEELDNWGILYNPETDFSFGVNPVSAFIWKQLKYKYTVKEIVTGVHENCTNVPGDVENHVIQFIEKLLEKGFVTLETA